MDSERNTIGVSSSTTSAYYNNNPSLMGIPKKDVHYYYCNVDYKEEDDKSYLHGSSSGNIQQQDNS
jgi:hypothetical protein